jgi:G:T-mismatch repair DNA endonuclease (very short patch repair protein)
LRFTATKAEQGLVEGKVRSERQRDIKKVEQLEELGWKVVVVWEFELKKHLKEKAKLIENILKC